VSKRLFLLALAVHGQWLLAAATEFDAKAEARLPLLPWRSIGLVLIKETARHRTYHSGFFVDRNVLLVASSPFAKTKSNGCVKETLIFAGQKKVTPNFDLSNVTPTHKCVEKISEDRLRGYALWKVEELDPKFAVNPITLLNDSIVEENGTDLEEKKIVFAGFSFSSAGAVLKVSEDCRYRAVSDPFDKDGLDPLIWDHRWDWSSTDCAFESGMQGGPLLIKDKGQWFASGLAVGETQIQNAAPTLLASNLVRLTRFLGEKLEEKEE
jgi:hypothetical protein